MANVIHLRTPKNIPAAELRNAGAYGTSAVIRLQVYSGSWGDVAGTGSTPTTTLVDGTEEYTGYDPTGTSSAKYRARFENSGATRTSDWTKPESASYG